MTNLIFKNKSTLSGVLFLLFISISSVLAQVREYTSVRDLIQDETLRRDFFLQGEYLCEMENTKIGLHLIADGDGKFRCVFYHGGLPGEGWNTGNLRVLGTVAINGENGLKFEINKSDAKEENVGLPDFPFHFDATWQYNQSQQGQGRGLAAIKTKFRDQDATFNKTQRRSATFNAKPPAGAVVFFDGSNVNMFQRGAKINEVQREPGNTLWAEATTIPFEQKPYTLHIEFMLSYMPFAKGQDRANSGVYIDEAYECQVLDSYGLDLANNHCGGFYQVKSPDINMCFPPLTWQTYDINFTPPKYNGATKVTNARITIKHNGVTIHENLELLKETPGRKTEANEPRGIYLQGHGNKVQYRNIWLKYND